MGRQGPNVELTKEAGVTPGPTNMYHTLLKPVSFLRVASDLHLEFTKFNPIKDAFLSKAILLEMLPEDPRDATSILVLAGDICNWKMVGQMYSCLQDRFAYVVHIPGNHEYYGGEMGAVNAHFRNLVGVHDTLFIPTAGNGVELLAHHEHAVVRILACTLWADAGKGNPVVEQAAVNFGNDFRLIQAGGHTFTPKNMGELNQADSAWLEIKLKVEPPRPDMSNTVVLTHYVPSHRLIHPFYKGQVINCIFASDQDPLFPKVDTWIFGHTHNKTDVELDGTHFISNPRGYPRGYPREGPCAEKYEPSCFIPLLSEATPTPTP